MDDYIHLLQLLKISTNPTINNVRPTTAVIPLTNLILYRSITLLTTSSTTLKIIKAPNTVRNSPTIDVVSLILIYC